MCYCWNKHEKEKKGAFWSIGSTEKKKEKWFWTQRNDFIEHIDKDELFFQRLDLLCTRFYCTLSARELMRKLRCNRKDFWANRRPDFTSTEDFLQTKWKIRKKNRRSYWEGGFIALRMMDIFQFTLVARINTFNSKNQHRKKWRFTRWSLRRSYLAWYFHTLVERSNCLTNQFMAP